MKLGAADILTDAIKEYYGNYELEELCSQFNIDMDYLGMSPNHKKLALNLVAQEDYNHQKCLEKMLPDLLQRCNQRILNTTWESNIYDEQMLTHLKKLQLLLADRKKQLDVAAAKNYIFKAKAEIIKFFNTATTAVTIVDTHIGLATFECLQLIRHPIRLLTSREEQALANNFGQMVKKFRQFGHDIEIRRHLMLHDHYLFFNGHCWLASCSLSQAEKKRLCVIECIDAKAAIAREIERKWREAEVLII